MGGTTLFYAILQRFCFLATLLWASSWSRTGHKRCEGNPVTTRYKDTLQYASCLSGERTIRSPSPEHSRRSRRSPWDISPYTKLQLSLSGLSIKQKHICLGTSRRVRGACILRAGIRLNPGKRHMLHYQSLSYTTTHITGQVIP